MFLSDLSSYCATLYDGLKSCPQDRHVHVLCDTDYIAHLMGRAEPVSWLEGMQYLYPVVAHDRAFKSIIIFHVVLATYFLLFI